MATTDAHGRYAIHPLATGDYVLRVHLAGFVSSRRDGVRVGPATSEVAKILMHRIDDPAALPARPILTAGVALPAGESPTGDGDNHSETAWRLRHIKRSVLKDDGDVVSISDAAREAGDAVAAGNSSLFGRAFDNAANMAATFFTATPFSGEVNFLTTSALGDGPMLFSDMMPRGVAYMSIGAPAASGRWDVRASMSQSDVSAWVLAGSFASRLAETHNYGFGVSYSTQQYQNVAGRGVAFARRRRNAERRRDLRQRSLDRVAGLCRRLRRALRALRLSAPPLAAQSARRGDADPVHGHAGRRRGRAAHAGARGGGISARGVGRSVAAARTHLRATRGRTSSA